MAYVCEISAGHRVFLDNTGQQTTLVCYMGQPGQQQQSSSSFTTGTWTQPPMLLRSAQGVFIQLQTEQGNIFIQIQGGSFQVTSQQAIGNACASSPMEAIPTMPQPARIPTMPPMTPMQPMSMGHMTMNSAPMQMQMGDMQMSMGHVSHHSTHQETTTNSHKNFCSNCGASIQANDQFCSSCGTKLN